MRPLRPAQAKIRLNQIQVIGTHNSYYQRADPSLMTLTARHYAADVRSLDYTHPPLPEQLEREHVRQITPKSCGQIPSSDRRL